MRTRLLPATIALALLALAGAAPAAPAHHSDLLGQWHLDEGAEGSDYTTRSTPDDSGHDLEALTRYVRYTPGRFRGALQVAGGSRVHVDRTPVLEPKAVTLLAWVREEGDPGTNRYIASKGAVACDVGSYALWTGRADADGVRFSVRTGGAVVSSPSEGAGMWDGRWHLVAGTYDGEHVRLYVDGRQVGEATPATGAIDFDLPTGSFRIGQLAGAGLEAPQCQPYQGYFVGQIDEARVYGRALTATEIGRLAAHTGPNPPVLEPDPAPDPVAPPQPDRGSPLPVPAPRVTAINAVRAITRGAATVLEARVAGPVQRLEWSLRGDPAPEIVAEGEQTAVRFRLQPGPNTIVVRAVGPGGEGPPLTQTIHGPAAAAGRVPALIRSKPPVDAVGSPGRFAITDVEGPCLHTTVRSGALKVTGCLPPVERLEDIPPNERGIVQALAQQLNLPLTPRALESALGLSDVYLSRDRVKVNGVTLSPGPNAAIVVAPQLNAIASSDASLSVGALKLAHQRRFVIDTRTRGGMIDLGSFARLPGGIQSVGRLPFVGDVRVRLVPANAFNPDGGVRVLAKLALPEVLRIGGVRAEGSVELRANRDGLVLDKLTIGPINGDLGALSVKDVRFEYSGGSEWRGQGKACVVARLCLDMIPPNGSVVIRDGELNYAGASLTFPEPGVQLFPGVALERVGFGVGLNPTRFTGNARISVTKLLVVDGHLVLALPSARTPFRLDRNEVGGGYPAHFYERLYTRTTIGVSATASLRLPVIGETTLGNAYFLYEHPGYIAFGGGARLKFESLSISGSVDGELNLGNKRFSITGGVQACLGSFCGGAIAAISSRGAGACIDLGVVQVGGGIIYKPFEVKLWPFDGCRWSRFREPNVRSAQANGPLTVAVRRGEPNRAVELRGAPRIRVTGPDGQTAASPAESGVVASGAIRIIRSTESKLTVVGLQDAQPGSYRIELLPGSPAITRVRYAEDQPPAEITAHVQGSGATRTLVYDVAPREAQRVTFVERTADGTAREIGTVAGGGRGTLRFTPAPGTDTRTIVARLELDGMAAEAPTVARFSPPSPTLGRPARLRVQRRGTSLRAAWTRVPGATAYEVVVTSTGGAQQRVRTSAPRASVRAVARSSRGRLSVRAVAEQRSGPARSRPFRATATRRTSLRPLARCRVGSRVVCRPQRS